MASETLRAPPDPRAAPIARAFRELPPGNDAEARAERVLLHRMDLKERLK